MAKQKIDLNEIRAILDGQGKARKIVDENGEVISNVYINSDGDPMRIGYKPMNCQLNIRNGNIEFIVHDEPFKVPEHLLAESDIITDRFTAIDFESVLSRRKFNINENGVAVQISDESCIRDLVDSMTRGAKRAIQNFYNYALSNPWQYFCSFTSRDASTRTDRGALYSVWEQFLSALRRDGDGCNKDLKAIAILEPYKNKETGLHFHSLLADCVLTLRPAINPHTHEFMYSAFRGQQFNCPKWRDGYNTVVCIDPNSIQSRVVNYLSKYMTKERELTYGCKRYFHTRNLDSSYNYLDNMTDDKIAEFVSAFGLTFDDRKKRKGVSRYYYSVVPDGAENILKKEEA